MLCWRACWARPARRCLPAPTSPYPARCPSIRRSSSSPSPNSQLQRPTPTRVQEALHEFMAMLLRKVQRHADAAPFLHPVPAADVPDYYTVIIVSRVE